MGSRLQFTIGEEEPPSDSRPGCNHKDPQHRLDEPGEETRREEQHSFGPAHHAAPPVEALGFRLGPEVGHQHRSSHRQDDQRDDPLLGSHRGTQSREDGNLPYAIRHSIEEGTSGRLGPGCPGNRAIESVQRGANESNSSTPAEPSKADQDSPGDGYEQPEEGHDLWSDTTTGQRSTDGLEQPLNTGPHPEIDHRRVNVADRTGANLSHYDRKP